MRTPKIHSLYALIDWLNFVKNSDSLTGCLDKKHSASDTIEKLPLSYESLGSTRRPQGGGMAPEGGSTPWLSGFIEGDGSVQVIATAPNAKNKYPKVECRFELYQSQTSYNGLSNYSFMRDIATFLDSSFKEVEVRSKFLQYRVRTVTLSSNIKLENNLNKYPLFSSKYLNYID